MTSPIEKFQAKYGTGPKKALSKEERFSKIRHHVLNYFHEVGAKEFPVKLVSIQSALNIRYPDYLNEELDSVLGQLHQENILSREGEGRNRMFNYLSKTERQVKTGVDLSEKTEPKQSITTEQVSSVGTTSVKEELPEDELHFRTLYQASLDEGKVWGSFEQFKEHVKTNLGANIVVSSAKGAEGNVKDSPSTEQKTKRKPRKTLNEEEVLRFLQPGISGTTDVARNFNVAMTTAVRCLEKLKEDGRIFRTTTHSPWVVKVNLDGTLFKSNTSSTSIESVKPNVRKSTPGQISYDIRENGEVIMHGLLHHDFIHLTATELLALVKRVNSTPLDIAESQ